MDSLQAVDVQVSFAGRKILKQTGISVPKGKICSILGPNGSGKSTLLRVLSRLLKPEQGHILLDGKDIHSCPSRDVAKRLSLLPQQMWPPEAMTVEDLVWFGRHPHQSLFKGKSEQDHRAVSRAMEMMRMSSLATRRVDQLSGGQRQRAFLAMVLAQQTELILLDEPTTFLDINFQFEILGMLKELNGAAGTTILMVLHDLNMASLISDHVFLMDGGAIVGSGTPREVFKGDLLERVFKVKTKEVAGLHDLDHPQFIFTHPGLH